MSSLSTPESSKTTGRIGAYQNNAPYTDPYIYGPYATGTTGYCSDYIINGQQPCSGTDYPYLGAGCPHLVNIRFPNIGIIGNEKIAVRNKTGSRADRHR